MHRKMPFNFRLPSVRATGRPRQREPKQPQVLGQRLRRWRNLPAGLPGPVNPRSPCLPAYLVGRPRSDGVSGTKGSERHRSHSGERNRRSHVSDRRQDSPRSHHSSRHDSGRWESGERAQPTSSGGSSSRRQADSTGGPGSSRVSSRAMDVRPSGSSSHSHHHHRKSSGDRRSLSSSSSRASADRKSPPGHHQDHGRRESAERSGSSYVSRREVQLSPVVAQSPERRTITVIPSLTRLEDIEESAVVKGPAEVDDPARVAGQTEAVDGPAGDNPAGDSPADDDPASDGPADDAPADDGSAGDGSARGPVMVTDDEPEIVDDPEEVPTQHTVKSQQRMAQHMMMSTRQVWPAQHTIRPRQWTAQQWLMDQWPMVLQQGTRKLQDKTHPCCRMSAVFFSLHCQEGSTRLLWLTSCPCGLWCNVGWTRVWLFLMPSPSKNYWQFSSTILIQFSCNSHAIIDEIFRNAPAILTYNFHPILTRQFSPAILIQFSPAILTWQFISNFHLTILTWQFSSNSHLQFSLNSHQHCSVSSHQQCSANFLVMISQSVLISHAAIFIQCWFYNGSE